MNNLCSFEIAKKAKEKTKTKKNKKNLKTFFSKNKTFWSIKILSTKNSIKIGNTPNNSAITVFKSIQIES